MPRSKPPRQEFSSATIRTIAQRASYLCSNPACRCLTTTAPREGSGVDMIGEAAHIIAAASDGPRGNEPLEKYAIPSVTSPENAIWLCSIHHKQIDDHPELYPVELLLSWKKTIEAFTHQHLGRSPFQTQSPVAQPSAQQQRRFLSALPPRPEHFTGREVEMERLLGMLHPGRAVTLVAPGGMGKTALAVEALYQLPEDRFPDGIFFHTFYHQPQAALCLEWICRAFGLEPSPDPAQAAGMVLANRRALLVLDGAEQADDLRPILNICGECGVLITSRRRSDAANFEDYLELTPLGEDKSLALLKKWGGECAADEQAGGAIIRIIGGLPLAIRLVGRYLREQNQAAREYLEWLESTPLEALEQGDRQLESVPLLLERSLRALPEAAGRILGWMGALAYAPLPLELLQPALELPRAEERRLLAALVDYGLVVRRKAGYPLVELAHPLVHTYASGRLPLPMEAAGRMAGHLYSFFKEQTALGAAGFQRLEAYRPHLLRLQSWLLAREERQAVISITWAMDDYLDLSGHWTEYVAALQAGYQAATGVEDRYTQGAFLTHLGLAYADLGQVEKAIQHYQQALGIAREIGDRRGEGARLGNLGAAYYRLGQVEKAIEHYEEALVIAREIGDRHNEDVHLGNLGLAYAALGQVEKAIQHYQQALVIDREIGDRRGEGADLGNLGQAYADLGQVEKAIQHYQQALVIDREIGDRGGEGADLGNLGQAYADLGQMEKAIEHYQQALVIAREIGDRRGEGARLGSLGNAYRNLGQVEKAIEHYQGALVIAREIGDRRNEGIHSWNLGLVYEKNGDIAGAIAAMQVCVDYEREIGHPDAEEDAAYIARLKQGG